MAYTNSKNCYASVSGTYCYVLSVSWDREPTQNIPENFSTVNATAKLYADRIAFDSIDTYKLEIGWTDNSGNTSFSSKNNITFKALGMYGTKTVSASFRVYHRNDGTLSGYATARWHCPGTSGGYTPSGVQSVSTSNITFTSIPRASSYGTVSGSTIGGNITVNINRHSNSFTHSLWFHHEKMQWQGIGSNIGTSRTFTLPMNVCNCFPNNTGGNISLILRTFNGGTQIGSDQWKTIWVNVPDSVKPTMGNPTAARVDNGVPSTWGVFVQGYSKVTVNIPNAAGAYGSTIKSYRISGPGIDSWSSAATSSVLNSVGTCTYTCTATDTRGRSISKNVSVNVLPYSPPSISVDAKRCDSAGVETSNGTYLKVTVNYSIDSVGGKNTLASSNVTCNGVSQTTFTSGTPFILAANCSIGSAYALTANVSDSLGKTASASINIQTAERVLNVKANKKGVAIGKFCEKEGFEVGWESEFNNVALFNSPTTIGRTSFFSGKIAGGQDNAPGWSKIGTYISGENGSSATITIWTGDGWNARVDQNTKIELFIKDGHQNTPSPTNAFAGTYEVSHHTVSSSTKNIKVKLIATSPDNLDIWVYFPWLYYWGRYEVKYYYKKGWTDWVHSRETSATEPSYGVIQNCENVTGFFGNNSIKLYNDCKVIKMNTQSSWRDARRLAGLASPNCNSGSYHPLVDWKTPNGDWSIGTVGWDNGLNFSYVTDDNFNAGVNTSSTMTMHPGGIFNIQELNATVGQFHSPNGNGTRNKIGSWGNLAYMDYRDPNGNVGGNIVINGTSITSDKSNFNVPTGKNYLYSDNMIGVYTPNTNTRCNRLAVASTYLEVWSANIGAKGINYSFSSDLAIKHGITPSNISALSKVNKIKFYDFTYNESMKHIGLGFIAQQMEEVDPDFVKESPYGHDGKDTILSIDTDNLIVYLTKSIQELQLEVENLRTEIKELKRGTT